VKIELDYNPIDGQISTNSGVYIGVYTGLESHESTGCKTDIDSLVKLKDAGFTAEEIIEMKKKELI